MFLLFTKAHINKMEKKQTAVGWLIEKWSIQGTIYSSDIFQAKQMEKEQIIDAFGEKRQIMGFGDGDEFWITDITAEQYYNETFKQQENGK